MMKKAMVSVVLYVGLSAVANQTLAEDNRQLGAHLHGAAKMDLVVESQTIALYFESPAVNIIGFEHAPENPEQQSMVEEAKKALGEISNVIELPDHAGCVLSSNSVEWVVEGDEHEEHEERAAHSEFQAEYILKCRDIARVESVSVNLFDRYEGLDQIALQAALPSGQTAMKLTPSSNTIPLK